MDRSPRVNTLWADAIGAVSRLSNHRVTFYLSFGWRRRRDTERPSGKKFRAVGFFYSSSLVGIPYEHRPHDGLPSELLLYRRGFTVLFWNISILYASSCWPRVRCIVVI